MRKPYCVAACFFSLVVFLEAVAKKAQIGKVAKNVVGVESESQFDWYDGIIAIVNGDIITAVDLNERLRLAVFSLGGSLSKEQKNSLCTQVLKEMIEEKLKEQCVKKFAPKGGWISKEALDQSLVQIAERNNMTFASFLELLKSKGIRREVLVNQVRGAMAWVEYIRARFGRRSNLSSAEIKKATEEMNEKLMKESFHIGRMFFPVLKRSDAASVLAHVTNLYKMLENGADFASMARQFSKSPDANRGGELGWIFEGQLSPVEMNALREMNVGSYKIVKNNKGYVILHLKNRKAKGMRSFTDLQFYQVVVSFADGKPPKEHLDQLLSYLRDMKAKSKDYKEFMREAKKTGFIGVADDISSSVLEALQQPFRNIMEKLPVGGISDPIVMDGGVIVFCVADKKVNTMKTFTEDDIRMQKTEEQLGAAARNELDSLKRKAYISVNKKYDSESLFVS